jgi:sterol desaturase/sphingolipid hydroxylase (fatty acid hydroxylase superfamily)
MNGRALILWALRWLSFPVALAAVVVSFFAFHSDWLHPAVLQLSIFGITLTIILIAERYVTYRADWQVSQQSERRVDLRSAAMLMFVVDPFLKFGLWPALMATVVSTTGSPNGLNLFPTTLPLAAQLLLAIVTAEFAAYWLHRAAHSVRWMWGAHHFHHSPVRLYWLNGLRVNPLNIVWFQFATVAVLMLFGTPEDILMTVTALTTVVSLMQHANADLRFDGWNQFFATADLHRWHHDSNAGDQGTNFGTVTVLWDRLFGTYRRGHAGPRQIGIDNFNQTNTGYWSELRRSYLQARG